MYIKFITSTPSVFHWLWAFLDTKYLRLLHLLNIIYQKKAIAALRLV